MTHNREHTVDFQFHYRATEEIRTDKYKECD